MKKLAALLALLLWPALALGQTGAYSGHTFVGGVPATTSGMNSSNYMDGIIPGASVTVYLTGTSTKATIYADGSNTPLSNPFFSNLAKGTNPGGFIFWAAINQGMDIQAQGGMGNASCTTSPLCYSTATTLQTDVYPNNSFASGCLGGNTIANGCTGATSFTPNQLLLTGPTSTSPLTNSGITQTGSGTGQLDTFPGTVAPNAITPTNPVAVPYGGTGATTTQGAATSIVNGNVIEPSVVSGAINPTQPPFNADPTGVNDSTAAINNALAAAGQAAQKTVLLPPGLFTHNSLITIPAGVALIGSGPTTTLEATNALANQTVTSWTTDASGNFTVTVLTTAYLVKGSPITVSGMTNPCSGGNPNGTQDLSQIPTATTFQFSVAGATCTAGSGTTGSIVGTAPLAAVELTGSGAQLQNLNLTTNWTGAKQSLSESSAVANQASNFVINGVAVTGSAAVGFNCWGCSFGVVSNSSVSDNLKDGFYNSGSASGGAHDVVYVGDVANNTGDDSFSVDSSIAQGISYDISFVGDTSNASQARAFEVGSGQNISFSGITAYNPAKSCIFIYSGGSFLLGSTTNISVTGATLSGCSAGGAGLGAAVYIASDPTTSSYTTSNVTISGVNATGINGDGVQIGDGAVLANTIKVAHSSFAGLGTGNYQGVYLAGASDVTLDDLTLTNFGQYGIASPPTSINSGDLKVHKNTMYGNNTTASVTSAVALGLSGFSDISVVDNIVNPLSNSVNPLTTNLAMGTDTPRLNISGNLGTVTLPAVGSAITQLGEYCTASNSSCYIDTSLSGGLHFNVNSNQPIIFGTGAITAKGYIYAVSGLSYNPAGTATSGANYTSLGPNYVGSCWNGSAAVSCAMNLVVAPATGTNPFIWLKPTSSWANGYGVDLSGMAQVKIGGTVTMTGLTNADTGDYVCYNAGVIEYDATACVASLGKFKMNIVRLHDALSEVMNLKPVEFRYVPSFNHGDRMHVGFIAEDVEKVDPRIAAYTDKGELESVDYEHITAVLAAAIQEQQKEIKKLQRELAALKHSH